MASTLPTMASSKRQKIDRESNAAYITSQPLFDALRKGITAMSDQKALLKTARDTVQALHVKVINGDAAQHELYMKHIVASWMGVAETYHDIFRQLVLITAADPSEGREATGPHGHLVAVLETVREARDLVQEVWTAKVDAESSEDEDAVEKGPEITVEKDLASDSASDSPPSGEPSRPTPTSLPTGPKKRPFVDDASAEEDPKKTPKLDETISKNKAKRQKSAAAKQTATKQAAVGTASTENVRPERSIKDPAQPSPAIKVEEVPPSAALLVEYENVGSEVEARLKAKAEKAAAKRRRRADKKRKRESVDSFANTEPETTSAKEETLAKPKKKKAKKTHVEAEKAVQDARANQQRAIPKMNGATSQTGPGVGTQKRKSNVENAPAEGGGGGGKKRKTKSSGKS